MDGSLPPGMTLDAAIGVISGTVSKQALQRQPPRLAEQFSLEEAGTALLVIHQHQSQKPRTLVFAFHRVFKVPFKKVGNAQYTHCNLLLVWRLGWGFDFATAPRYFQACT